ncbi:MAG: hypothetical protein ACE364_09340 [Chlorobiota bacterium]
MSKDKKEIFLTKNYSTPTTTYIHLIQQLMDLNIIEHTKTTDLVKIFRKPDGTLYTTTNYYVTKNRLYDSYEKYTPEFTIVSTEELEKLKECEKIVKLDKGASKSKLDNYVLLSKVEHSRLLKLDQETSNN